MSQKLVLITEIISPYRIPLFNALAQRAEIDLHVVFLAETDPSLRQWEVLKREIRFSYEVLPSLRKRVGKYNFLLNGQVSRTLRRAGPDAIVCGGYSYIASWQSLLWARAHSIPFLLWSESNKQDLRRGTPVVEFLKREFLERCSGFVVPGLSAREYLRWHKIADELIFTAPNAVDNEHFAAIADSIGNREAEYRRQWRLPDRYFLFVGRLVAEKGVFELLESYLKLDEPLRAKVGLVFVGDGDCRRLLEQQAAKTSAQMIRFAGFVQRDDLAKYYALADALILPTHTDPWGLVVNEAMACALPIVLSSAAGCAADLVRDGYNGWLVAPTDISALTCAMQTLGNNPNLGREMGTRSRQHIFANNSPAAWALGTAQAITGHRSAR